MRGAAAPELGQGEGAASPVRESRPWLPGGPLPAALVTGHAAIDAEHGQLLSSMTSLRRICTDYAALPHCRQCAASTRRDCESGLISLLGDLLAFILDHFVHEEGIMRDTLMLAVDRDVCEAHIEDHAAISAKVQQIVARLEPEHLVERIRELDRLLSRWLNHHIALHDVLLVRWVDRQEFASLRR